MVHHMTETIPPAAGIEPVQTNDTMNAATKKGARIKYWRFLCLADMQR